MPATILASTTNILRRLLELHGHDPVFFFNQAGLKGISQGTTGARLSFAQNNLLWRKADEVVDDPGFGLRAAECWHPSDFNALGYAWLASSSLRSALQRLCRYTHMLSGGVAFDIKDHGDELTLTATYQEFAKGYPARNLANIVILLDMCRMNYGAGLNPVSVTFSHMAPVSSYMQEYETYFRCPVFFDHHRDSLTLPQAAANKQLTSSNPQMAGLSDQIIVNYLAQLDDNDISHKAKKVILQLLSSGKISRRKVAQELKMSERSLHRRLRDQGVNYRILLDKTRQELAEKYIGGTETSITEISFLLGFSETSSFSRAFRRWQGASPVSSRQYQAPS